MRPIFSPSILGSFAGQFPDHVVRSLATICILTIDADDVMNLAHAEHEIADKVESVFLNQPSRHAILCSGDRAVDFGNG